jgi:hypothetical protein
LASAWEVAGTATVVAGTVASSEKAVPVDTMEEKVFVEAAVGLVVMVVVLVVMVMMVVVPPRHMDTLTEMCNSDLMQTQIYLVERMSTGCCSFWML